MNRILKGDIGRPLFLFIAEIKFRLAGGIMARTVEDIRKLKTYAVDELYGQTRVEQAEDLTYINDTFDVPIRDPHKAFRSGIGRQIAEAPISLINTTNPKAAIKILKGRQEAGRRISEVVNNEWIPGLLRQNPNPLKEFATAGNAMGEVFYKVLANESWITTDSKGKDIYSGLPFKLIVPASMVIFASPEEDDDGVPEWVIVWYERQRRDLILTYPHLQPLEEQEKKTTSWLEYWDKDIKYIEAGEIPITDGIVPNPYKRPPFIRRYSGFGRRSPDGELSNLIVGDLRFQRDLIQEECIVRSNINSIEMMFAHRGKLITTPDNDLDEDAIKDLEWGMYNIKIIKNFKVGSEIKDDEVKEPPSEMYAHLAQVRKELAQRNPLITVPGGTSGRHADKIVSYGLDRYNTLIYNTKTAFATALEMALEICNTLPGWKPEGLNAGDLDTKYRVDVDLKATAPIEEDRLITLGDRLRRLPNPAIDLETFHTQFMSYTEPESRAIQAKMLADMVTIYNPDWAEVAGMVAAEESGMEMWLEKLKQRRQMAEGQQKGLGQVPPTTTQQRGQGEVQTEEGRETGTQAPRGARIPPDRYTGGGE